MGDRQIKVPEGVFTPEVEEQLNIAAVELPRAMAALRAARSALGGIKGARGMRGTRLAELGERVASGLSEVLADLQVNKLEPVARAVDDWCDR